MISRPGSTPSTRGAPVNPADSRWRRYSCTAGDHGPSGRQSWSPRRTMSLVIRPPAVARGCSLPQYPGRRWPPTLVTGGHGRPRYLPRGGDQHWPPLLVPPGAADPLAAEACRRQIQSDIRPVVLAPTRLSTPTNGGLLIVWLGTCPRLSVVCAVRGGCDDCASGLPAGGGAVGGLRGPV